MANYYFLASILSDLQLSAPPELGFFEFNKLLAANLTPKDYVLTKRLRGLYDIQNIRAVWLKEEVSEYGNFNEGELDEALLTREGLPQYVYDFLDRYDVTTERLRHYPGLLGTYFRKEIATSTGFLKEYLTFEREWRLVATAIRAKVLGRDVAVELQHEDSDDDLVMQILAQKDAKRFEPPQRFEGLSSLFDSKSTTPMALHQALCEYRFSFVDGMISADFFSIDRILGYMAELILVESWQALDRQEGKEIVDRVVKEAS